MFKVLNPQSLNIKPILLVIMRKLTAIIQKEEDMYVAKCPEVGTVSQGATIEEAIDNLKEATELYLEEFYVVETSPPLLTTFEVKEIVKT